jgi:hypothetical protein
MLRSGFKTASKAQWLRCPAKRDSAAIDNILKVHHKPLQTAHILPCMLRFFIGSGPRFSGMTHLF